MKCGLIGENIGYSYSKDIHSLFGDYDYEIYSVAKSDFDDFIKKDVFDGLNVTIPYKKEIMKFCDELDPLAEKIGAVNTIFHRDGKLIGANTDYFGFCYMIDKAGIDLSGAKVAILGSGGAQATVKQVSMDRNAKEIYVVTRNEEKAKEKGFCSYRTLPSDIDVLVNTTPVGTHPNYANRPVDLTRFDDLKGVVDLIYNPFQTALLIQAEDLGIPCTNGLPMLVGQANAAREFFLSGKISSSDNSDKTAAKNQSLFSYDFAQADAANKKIVDTLIKQKTNIVLIGMPGSGKTTLGKALGKRLGKDFFDCDLLIEQTEGISPAEIINEKGEDVFRATETKIVKELASKNSAIIATGGGTVTRKENMQALRHNGLIIYLKTPIDRLATKDRPLSKGGSALRSLYKERDPLYSKYANLTISNEGTFEETLDAAYALLK